MTASVHAWHDLLADSSMEGVEEGFLDETDNATLKIHQTSTTFPRTVEHGWKELVSDPSLSEAEISENRKNQGNNDPAEIGRKDWEHYLSTFSLNDDDPTKFMALEVHTEHDEKDGKDGKASDFRKCEKNSFDMGNKSTVNVMDGVETETLPKISRTDGQKSIIETQRDLNQVSDTNMLPASNTVHSLEKTSKLIRRPNSDPLRTSARQPLIYKGLPPATDANSQWQTEIRPGSAPAREAKEMQAPVEDSNILPVDANNVSSVMFKSSRNLPLTNSGHSGMKIFQARSQSALNVYGNNYFPKQLSSVPRANSAPLWDNTDRHMSLNPVTTAPPYFQSDKVHMQSDQASHVRPNRATKIDDWESSLEQRKISGADEDMLHKVRLGAQRNSDDKILREAKESFVGNVSDGTIQTSYSRTSRPNSRLATGMDGKERTDETKTVPFEDFPHPSGDGMHGTKSDDDMNEDFDLSRGLKVPNIHDAEDESKRSLENGNQHLIAKNVHDASHRQEEQDSSLLVDLELNTDSVSSNTHQIFTMARPDQTECSSETSNVATFRETAENLPVRPLTIGDSLTIGSTLAYRPVSPFQPDLYPTGAPAPISVVPSTTSVPTTHLSASQYSEGALEDDEEREGDMSARERLQPLGRDGLEVKQGPPWGITMPLFQPNSRDSSLSSSDSSGSNAQIVQLQTTSNQQLKVETEPLQSMSSMSSETDLSRKASIKSVEPKEPMGVKIMKDAGNLRTPIRKFQELYHNDGDSPVSKILGPTFKATQKMLEELQRRPLVAYDEDVVEPPRMDNENTRNERKTSVERETVVTDKRTASTTSIESREERSIKESGSTQDRRHSHSYVSSASWEEADKTTSGSYRELSVNQETPDLTPITTTYLGGVGGTCSSEVDNLQKVGDSKPSRGTTPRSADDLQNVASASRAVVHEFITNQQTPNMTSVTTTHLEVVTSDRNSVPDGLQEVQVSRPFSKGKMQQSTSESLAVTTENMVSTTRSPLVSLKDGMSQRVVDNLVGSQYQASGHTDSTLANSVGLSGHLVSPEVGTYNEGNTEPKNRKSENVLDSRHDASDMSEFDRVASESISWSNAVVNQFREEMKSVDLGVQEGFLDTKDDMTLVKEPRTTTSILDSGLSESSSNEEMYRPKRLPRLSPGEKSVGIYDVRRSSGPGSTNRKRLALGRQPRPSSKPLLMGNIYVSDSATGTSDTDRDTRGRQSAQRIHGGVYVSEETTSGAEPVDNGMDSVPEGQSTPKSEDVSTRQSDALTPGGFFPRDSNKSMTDMYLGVENSMSNKPTKSSRSSFSANEIGKPTSVFTDYKPLRQDPPLFSTFEVKKPLRANSPGTLGNGTLTRGHTGFKTNVLAEPQKDSNVMRQTSPAKVEHTWSISRPVMSQLSTGAAPSLSHDIYREPKSTTQQTLKQMTSHQPEYRHKREPRHKKTVPKTVPQHTKYQTTESSKSEKDGTIDKNGTTMKKKSVADIILENMIQDEQEQKKRHNRLEVKQEQTTQDLNLLWERFQDVFGKKSRSSRMSKRSQTVRARPSRESTPTDISLASSSNILSSENGNINRQSTDISTESDEEFERFLRRIREIRSSESSYQEDNESMTSRASSSSQRVRHHQTESETTPSQRSQRKPRHKSVDSSTSMTSTTTSEDRRMRRNIAQGSAQERRPRKAARDTVDNSVVISSSVTDRDSEIPVSLPMWLSVKNKEMMKPGKVSTAACTCGAKSRKEKQKTLGVRDIGVNCPTPPITTQEFQPVATDIAVLKAGPLEEIISNPIPPPASLVKLSLQDAFMYSKQDFIERSRERVKKVKEKCEERKQEKTSSPRVVVVMPSEKMKARKEDKKPEEDKMYNMKSSKQFEQLQRKKPRPMTTKEIRDVNKRMYKNLPEVRKKRDEERRAQFYKTNRLRAQLYGKHVRNTNRIFTAA